MRKKRAALQDDLEEQHRERRRAEERDRRELHGLRQQNLERMEPDAERHVEREVGVVDAMRAPEDRHTVQDAMLEIDDGVEREDADDDLDRLGPAQRGEEPDAVGAQTRGEDDADEWEKR